MCAAGHDAFSPVNPSPQKGLRVCGSAQRVKPLQRQQRSCLEVVCHGTARSKPAQPAILRRICQGQLLTVRSWDLTIAYQHHGSYP